MVFNIIIHIIIIITNISMNTIIIINIIRCPVGVFNIIVH